MAKMLLFSFLSIFISLETSANLITIDPQLSDGDLIVDHLNERLNSDFSRVELYERARSDWALGIPLRDFFAANGYLFGNYSHVDFNAVTIEFKYPNNNQYLLANWQVNNNHTPVVEPVTVLLFFILFVALFFRGLHARLNKKHVHNFPVIF